MSHQVINPHWKPHLDLGISDVTWDAAKATLTAYLITNADTHLVDDAVLRALDPILADDLVWNQMTAALNLLPAH